jgi:hypothetical protein
LQRLLGRLEDEVAAAVLLGDFERRERHGHVLLADAEKAADADDRGVDLPVFVEQQIVHVTDLVIAIIVNALIVIVANGKRAAGQTSCHVLRA